MTSGTRGSTPLTEHFRRLEAMYHAAPVNRLYSPRLRVEEGRAVLLMDVDPRFFHPLGSLHGSVYFKALDDAAFFAVNSLVPDHFVLTASFTVHMLRPVAEGVLRAEGTVTRASSTLTFAEAVLFVGDDVEVARGSGTFLPSRVRLDTVPSYVGG